MLQYGILQFTPLDGHEFDGWYSDEQTASIQMGYRRSTYPDAILALVSDKTISFPDRSVTPKTIKAEILDARKLANELALEKSGRKLDRKLMAEELSRVIVEREFFRETVPEYLQKCHAIVDRLQTRIEILEGIEK